MVAQADAQGARWLLQSTPCPPDKAIPKCTDKACFIRSLPGLAEQVPVCVTCLPGYIKINKGRACACAAGRFDNGTGCQDCGLGYYCPGPAANFVATPNDAKELRGSQLPCDKVGFLVLGGLTTPTATAKNWKNCVTKPGYRLASTTTGAAVSEATQTARLCEPDRYNIGNNRLTACTPCPMGLVTRPGSPDPMDYNAKVDCLVPPGSSYDGNKVQPCPKGTYRGALASTNTLAACEVCGEGISTQEAGASSNTACTVVEAGYGADWDQGGFATNARKCAVGTYWPGGPISTSNSCTSCGGYITRRIGATSASECLAPPGYYLDSTTQPAQLKTCPGLTNKDEYGGGVTAAYGDFGTYRGGWATTPNGIRDCKVCGAGMLSMLTEESQHPLDEGKTGRDAVFVATSTASCYISQGQGLKKDLSLNAAISQWRAYNCPEGTVGATEDTQGTATAVVCRAVSVYCGKGYVYSAYGNECRNPAGFGAYTTEAIECPTGSWASYGSLSPCRDCGDGRTTLSKPANKQDVSDCYVIPGHGIYNREGTTEEQKWYDAGAVAADKDPDTLEIVQQAQLDVAECPFGRYSTSSGGEYAAADVSARCEKCPPYSTTEDTGSTSQEQCTVCMKGSGRPESAAYGQCFRCNRGSYNDGEKVIAQTGELRNSWACMQCPVILQLQQHSTCFHVFQHHGTDCIRN